MKGAERGSCATIPPLHDRIHRFLSVRSICIELCHSSCRAAGCPGPWNTRETSVKQWMMDDSGKPTFDKEWEVRGSDESKITGFRPAGIGKNLGVWGQVYFVTRQTKLLVVHWFSSLAARRVALTVPKLEFYPSPKLLFYLQIAPHFPVWMMEVGI